MINSSIISFDQTIRVATQPGFSDSVDIVRISNISQDNNYVHQMFK